MSQPSFETSHRPFCIMLQNLVPGGRSLEATCRIKRIELSSSLWVALCLSDLTAGSFHCSSKSLPSQSYINNYKNFLQSFLSSLASNK